jgi:heme-degrading monooxygenase HmoA
MHARVVFFNVRVGKRDEAVSIFRNAVIPAAKQLKGFSGGLLLTDPATGKVISIGLWDTEADMLATEKSGFYQGWVEKFQDVFANPPSMEHYEVSSKDM